MDVAGNGKTLQETFDPIGVPLGVANVIAVLAI